MKNTPAQLHGRLSETTRNLSTSKLEAKELQLNISERIRFAEL